VKLRRYYWYTQQGPLTSDNRDFCGIAEIHGISVCILVDGATGSPKCGELARDLVSFLLESCVCLDSPPSQEILINCLERAHVGLRRQYPSDVASYIIVLQDNSQTLTAIHAGDCRLGMIANDGSINWLTCVHTLANAIQSLSDDELRMSSDRHKLTRSFKGKRFETPDCEIFNLKDCCDALLLASDGFWADLSDEEQLLVLQGHRVQETSLNDDMSCFYLQLDAEQERHLPIEARISSANNVNLIIASTGKVHLEG
jgi:PPM family protein phosphatase